MNENIHFPWYPPQLVPGRITTLTIYDMKRWRGDWVVILKITLSATAAELVSHVDLSQLALEWVCDRMFELELLLDNERGLHL